MSEVHRTKLKKRFKSTSHRILEAEEGSTTLNVCSTSNREAVSWPIPFPDQNHPARELLGTLVTVTITRNPDANQEEEYSLLNLGIQARLRLVVIKSVTGSNVLFRRISHGNPSGIKKRGPYVPRQPKHTSQRIRRVRKLDGQNDDDRIWYISFSGNECTLEVISFGDGQEPIVESDWAPPPPDPGGPYGEDEEPEDPPEEDGEEGDEEELLRSAGA